MLTLIAIERFRTKFDKFGKTRWANIVAAIVITSWASIACLRFYSIIYFFYTGRSIYPEKFPVIIAILNSILILSISLRDRNLKWVKVYTIVSSVVMVLLVFPQSRKSKEILFMEYPGYSATWSGDSRRFLGWSKFPFYPILIFSQDGKQSGRVSLGFLTTGMFGHFAPNYDGSKILYFNFIFKHTDRKSFG